MNKKDEITALYLQHKKLKEIDARHLTPAGVAYVQSVWDGMLEAFEDPVRLREGLAADLKLLRGTLDKFHQKEKSQ